MKVGVIQSNYVPWRGYFDFIDDVDLFIFYDDVMYGQGKKWRNRNRIKTRYGTRWITVPLRHGRSLKLINEVTIDYSSTWQATHYNQLYENYRAAPYWKSYIDQFVAIIEKQYPSISDLNVTLCKWIMDALQINTQVRMSHEFDLGFDKKKRLIDLLVRVGATSYVTGPNTEPYTDLVLFRAHEIDLEFKSYDYEPYPQLWSGFSAQLSVLDLLFNIGPEARKYLKSITPNRVAVRRSE
jgi:WbqC-like protein family